MELSISPFRTPRPFSQAFTNRNTTRRSRQHDECCQKLSENLHVPGDQVLVAIARISKVTVEVAGMIQRISEEPDYAAFALMHVKTLRMMLDETKRILTPEQLEHSQ